MKRHIYATRSAVIVSMFFMALTSLAATKDKTPLADTQLPATSTPKDTLVALSADLRALQKKIPFDWMANFPAPAIVPEQLKQEIKALHGKILAFEIQNLPPTPENARLFDLWIFSLKRTFSLRVMLEWQDFETSWTEFQKLERNFPNTDKYPAPQAHGKLIASLADIILQLWTSSHPSILIPWIEEFGEQSLADETGELPIWWLKKRCDCIWYLKDPINSRAQHPKTAEWLRAYLEAENENLDARSYVLSRQLTLLHSEARPLEALRLLTWWENLHPDDFSKNISLLNRSFFIHQIGLGDRVAARESLDRLDQLISEGSLSPANDQYRMVVQNYYENLMRSDLEHLRHIAQLTESRNCQDK